MVVEDLWNTERGVLATPLLTRFSKEGLDMHFVQRRVTNVHIDYPPEYYKWVKRIIKKRNRISEYKGFANVTLYRLASSSPQAFLSATTEDTSHKFRDPKCSKLTEIFSNLSSSHVLVFCEFKETIKLLEKEISNRTVYVMTGDTPLFERVSVVDQFRRDKNAVLLMTSVGSEGLDLQFADTVVNYDLHWNPMKIEQRIGRVDRIGQTKDEVHIFNFVVRGSIDERIVEVIKEKLSLTSGSVLQVNPIVDSNEKPKLYDEKTLDSEMQNSKNAITAMSWTRKIPNTDYEILGRIDTSYCKPSMIRAIADTDVDFSNTVLADGASETYLETINDTAEKLIDLLEFYS